MQTLKFNRTFLRDFWTLCKPFWVSTEKYYAFALLSLNILCVLVEVRARVAVNNFSKDFYDALQTFNHSALFTSLWHFVIILGILVLAFGYSVYFSGLLNIRWRKWLTQQFLQKWLNNQTYYRMQLHSRHIDNPDQRICEDLQKFADTTITLFFSVIYSVMIITVFGIILWGFSAYLFWCALLYALVGTAITGWIGKKLANINYQQQYYNADFRFSLIRLRESSEQVALHQGEMAENQRFENLFARIYKNFTHMITVKRNLTFFNNGYNTASFVFGLFVAIPLYLQRKILLGGLMQISGAFSYVIGSFSVFVNSFEMFAEWRSVIHRLTEFNQSVNESSKVKSNIVMAEHEHEDMYISNLQLYLPEGIRLLEQENFQFQKGKRYLIQGPTGSGKSIFLRALAGLWPYGRGEIFIPKNSKMIFLPQKPYIPLGTLREVLCYPRIETESNLEQIMRLCHLEKWISQLDVEKNWHKELSLGEQQLIAFARIFVEKPPLLFLDEATSAIDEKMQCELYENLIEFFPDAIIMSVSHHSSLERFHHHTIFIQQPTGSRGQAAGRREVLSHNSFI